MDIREKLWDCITQNSIATEEEIRLVTCINGYSEKTLMDIIYARIGLRSIEQMLSEGYEISYELKDYYGLIEEEEEEEL